MLPEISGLPSLIHPKAFIVRDMFYRAPFLACVSSEKGPRNADGLEC